MGYSHVQGLYAKQGQWDEDTLLYFVAAFKKAAAGRFDYANKFTRYIAMDMNVLLPATADGAIDFDSMARRIRQQKRQALEGLAAWLLTNR